MKRNFGLLLVGIWLVLHGLIALIDLSFHGLGTIMAVIAVVAGALLILGR